MVVLYELDLLSVQSVLIITKVVSWGKHEKTIDLLQVFRKLDHIMLY
jgi:hypothetical protein